MSTQCANEKAAVHTQEVRVLELDNKVKQAKGPEKKILEKELLLAKRDLDTAHRNLTACLSK